MSGDGDNAAARPWIDALPGWIFFLGGLILLAMAILMPVLGDLREMDGRLELMRSQAERMARQEESYQNFLAAVENDDPVLLERLAYYQLHLKPAGSIVLASLGTADPAWMSRLSMPTIEALLHEPLPDAKAAMRQIRVPNSRLVRLTSGPQQIVLASAALICLGLGLILPLGEAQANPKPEA